MDTYGKQCNVFSLGLVLFTHKVFSVILWTVNKTYFMLQIKGCDRSCVCVISSVRFCSLVVPETSDLYVLTFSDFSEDVYKRGAGMY